MLKYFFFNVNNNFETCRNPLTLPNHAKFGVIDKAYEPLQKHQEAEPQGLNTSKILFQLADLDL